jgi:hypothetical protein
MNRTILNGVPYFVAGTRVFTWDNEAEPQPIGTLDAATGQVTYADDHLAKLGARLQEWRGKQQHRPRKAPGAPSRGNARGRPATPAAHSDSDE